MTESHIEIIWTDYVKYRARLRGFDLANIEHIVRYSDERYFLVITDLGEDLENVPKKLISRGFVASCHDSEIG